MGVHFQPIFGLQSKKRGLTPNDMIKAGSGAYLLQNITQYIVQFISLSATSCIDF